MSDSVRPHRWQPTRLRCPWDSPGKNTGVGCHFLLQCMKVKNKSEVAQLCLTLGQPTRFPCPWIFQARVLEWGAIAFSEYVLIFVKCYFFPSYFSFLLLMWYTVLTDFQMLKQPSFLEQNSIWL